MPDPNNWSSWADWWRWLQGGSAGAPPYPAATAMPNAWTGMYWGPATTPVPQYSATMPGYQSSYAQPTMQPTYPAITPTPQPVTAPFTGAYAQPAGTRGGLPFTPSAAYTPAAVGARAPAYTPAGGGIVATQTPIEQALSTLTSLTQGEATTTGTTAATTGGGYPIPWGAIAGMPDWRRDWEAMSWSMRGIPLQGDEIWRLSRGVQPWGVGGTEIPW